MAGSGTAKRSRQLLGRMGPLLALVTAAVLCGTAGAPAAAGPPWFDGGPAFATAVRGTRFVDGYGREVVLRGFNVSGEAKLEENGGLPFSGTADARKSAAAMRETAGANAVRFLLSWAHAEPVPGQVDSAYLERATDQMRVFLDAGFRVLPDFHQDLYSRHLFHRDSWYSGDGAPKWVAEAGSYPREFCGICVHWGQNVTQNAAVRDANYDFWHNRRLTTPERTVGVQDAFLDTAERTMRFIERHLDGEQFARIIGFDPYNEPYAGRYDGGQDSRSWERDLLWPFYERFRGRMDAAGWRDKPAFVQPNLFWNANLEFMRQEGGLAAVGRLGPRFVLNAHFYDQKAISGLLMPGKAGDGQYARDFGDLRERAAALDSAAVVSEFGHPLGGYTSDKAPTVDKAIYQAMDSRLPGADWWARAAASGPVLSGTQWQWDIYRGRHHEPMNGNPDKVLTAADAWNGEDFSSVELDGTGAPSLRQDARLLDRLYPRAVAGRTLAFAYEDRSRDGEQTLAWNPVPSGMPAVRELVGSGQYGVLVWRSSDSPAPTELHLPQSFTPATTTVISDLGALTGAPGYAPGRPIAAAASGGVQRLLLSPPPGAGAVHYALVTHGPVAPSDELREAAGRELARWVLETPWPRSPAR